MRLEFNSRPKVPENFSKNNILEHMFSKQNQMDAAATKKKHKNAHFTFTTNGNLGPTLTAVHPCIAEEVT